MTTDADGTVTGSASADWQARAQAQAIVLHDPDHNMVACVTLDQAQGPVTLTLQGSSPAAGGVTTEYMLNDGEWMAYEGPVTIDQAGEVTLSYRGTDEEGTTSEPRSVTFTIVEVEPDDTTAPTVGRDLGG